MTDSIHPAEAQQRYRAQGLWPQVTLADRIAQTAKDTPDRTAVIDGSDGREVSYGRLFEDARRIAGWLRHRGVGIGDGVSVQLPNRYETVAIDVATLLLGARLNPLLPNYRRLELANILEVSKAAVLVTPTVYRGFDHVGLGRSLQRDLEGLSTHLVVGDDPPAGCVSLNEAIACDPVDDLPRLDPSAVSELIFTSGTESQPKAVMHTEEVLNHSVQATVRHLGLGDDDVIWMPSPIGHSTGLNFGVRLALLHGLPVLLQDQWDAAKAAELITAHRPTYTLAATTFLSDLLRAARDHGSDLSSLRAFGCGGAPVPAELVTEAVNKGVTVLRLYGSTEGLIISWNAPTSPREKREQTDGMIMPQTEVEVWDDDDQQVPFGHPGELMVRGPNVCVGFFNDPERTARSFTDDGWLRSGDVGLVDEDGYVSLVGRKKEIIIRGGLNIAPREIEDLLVKCPGVRDVAVIGYPDSRLGEITCACIVPEEDAEIELDDLVAFLKDRDLATYKLPQRLEILDELPKTATGKLRKTELTAYFRASAKAPS